LHDRNLRTRKLVHDFTLLLSALTEELVDAPRESRLLLDAPRRDESDAGSYSKGFCRARFAHRGWRVH